MPLCSARRFCSLRGEYGLLCGFSVTAAWLARDLRISHATVARYENKNYRPKDPNRVPLVVQLAMLYLISEARAGRPLYQPPPRFTPKNRAMHKRVLDAMLGENPLPEKPGRKPKTGPTPSGRPQRINGAAPIRTLVDQA